MVAGTWHAPYHMRLMKPMRRKKYIPDDSLDTSQIAGKQLANAKLKCESQSHRQIQ